VTRQIAAAMEAALGPDMVSIEPTVLAAHSLDWQTDPQDAVLPIALVRPRTADDVAATVRLCREHGCAITVQGGLTGLAGGAVPSSNAVALSLDRMNAIEDVDPVGATISVQAGATLQQVQESAKSHGMLFPLDLGARGTCRIGGNIGTNAGGNHVLRYGMMRDLVLGLEAVLADGTVVTAMNRTLKNNAGYDLKHLFIGSEGTLGIITRAVLRLYDLPQAEHNALCALPNYDAVGRMLRLARRELGTTLNAFELMWPRYYEFASHMRGFQPFREPGSYYLLLEASGSARDAETFQAVMEQAIEGGLVTDGFIAQSLSEAASFWQLRDASGELRSHFWPNANFDISINTSQIGRFVEVLEKKIVERWPDAEVAVFGHVADGNVHIAVKTLQEPFPATEIEQSVYALVGKFNGSISAEHGIGLAKKIYLHHSRSPGELEMMRRLKAALDPAGVLNPGKVF
jgi:FAD/FMN-containing dehydrogenase